MFSAKEKAVVRELQRDLSLSSEPFKEIAEKVGLTERQVLAKIKDWQEKRVIRRFGAILKHHQVGMKANVMVVWQVPSGEVSKIGEIMAFSPKVTHCYERPILPEWPYNLYTMIHGKTKKECQEEVESLAKKTGIKGCKMLFSRKELKRSTMEYF